MTHGTRTTIRSALSALLFLTGAAVAARYPVALTFHEEILVRDTLFTVGDLADVDGANRTLVEAVRSTVAGESAPPGYNRFLSVKDFILQRLGNRFPEADFSLHGASRPVIRTDYRTVTVGSLTAEIRSFIDSTIGWKPGEWQMEIANPDDSCKCFDAPVSVSFSGMRDQYPKGAVNLNCEVAQGTKTCRLTAAVR